MYMCPDGTMKRRERFQVSHSLFLFLILPSSSLRRVSPRSVRWPVRCTNSTRNACVTLQCGCGPPATREGGGGKGTEHVPGRSDPFAVACFPFFAPPPLRYRSSVCAGVTPLLTLQTMQTHKNTPAGCACAGAGRHTHHRRHARTHTCTWGLCSHAEEL